MPTYEYFCQQCGHEFEAFQSMKEAPLTTCPGCGKPTVKRKIGGGAGLIFKGSGFYITDYKKPAGGGSGGEGKSGESSGGKSDAKPAKTEAKPSTTSSS